MKKRFWKSDRFTGLIIPLVFLFATDRVFSQSLNSIFGSLGLQKSKHDLVALMAKSLFGTVSLLEMSLSNIHHFYLSQLLLTTTQSINLPPQDINHYDLSQQVFSTESKGCTGKRICT